MNANPEQQLSVSRVLTYNNEGEIIVRFNINLYQQEIKGISINSAKFICKKLTEFLQEGGYHECQPDS